jgi:hypothetical protein
MRGDRQLLLAAWRRTPGQQPAQFSKSCAQFMSVHDHIHHTVLREIFGALEALW